MRKIIFLVLVFSIFLLPGDIFGKQRRGADLIVEKLDGIQMRGELITVKEYSLLLLGPEGGDMSINIKEIRVIKVVKKSKALVGAGLGTLVGAGLGTILGLSVDKVNEVQNDLLTLWGPPDKIHSQVESIAIIGGLVGALGGGIIGTMTSRPKIYKISGKSQEEIRLVLKDLRTKARVPNYQ